MKIKPPRFLYSGISDAVILLLSARHLCGLVESAPQFCDIPNPANSASLPVWDAAGYFANGSVEQKSTTHIERITLYRI